MITRVIVQKQRGEFVSPNAFAAWRGFTERGFETGFFEWPDLRDGGVAVEPSTLVVGGAGAVTHALRRLGLATPTIDDLPEPLAAFRGRRVWQSTLGEIRAACHAHGPPVFVKPLRDTKAFPARVVAGLRDVLSLANLPDEMPVLASEPVAFASEWRFFVLRGRVVGAGAYAGQPLSFPDAVVVHDALAAWAGSAPVGYGIDFGVASDGRTLLVEVNEGYALGALGLAPTLYSEILEARWRQLMSAVVGGRAAELRI
jgi:hypothetical protein